MELQCGSIESSEDLSPKGNVRIFVKSEEFVEEAIQILRDMDTEEYDNYAPKGGIVTTPKTSTELIYLGKFDFEVAEYVNLCNEKGIDVFIASANPWTYQMGLTLEELYDINEIKFYGQCEIKANKEYRHDSNPQEKLLHDMFNKDHMDRDVDFIVFPTEGDTQNYPSDYLNNREKV